MEIIWDPKKAKANWLKHHIYFSDAESALFDPQALSLPDPNIEGEERFVLTGCDALGRIVTVVYTYRDETIRLISARKATKKERACYKSRI